MTLLAIPLQDTGLATHFVAPAVSTVELPSDLPDTVGCLIQPLSTVAFALDRLGSVTGQDALVLGFGAIGRMFSLLLRVRGASSVDAVDVAAAPDFASWGLDRFVQSDVADLSPNEVSADLVVDAVGHTEASPLAALRLVRPGGKILIFGLPTPAFRIELAANFYQNVTIVTSVNPPWRTFLHRATGVAVALQTQLAGMVTHAFDLADAADAFQTHDLRWLANQGCRPWRVGGVGMPVATATNTPSNSRERRCQRDTGDAAGVGIGECLLNETVWLERL